MAAEMAVALSVRAGRAYHGRNSGETLCVDSPVAENFADMGVFEFAFEDLVIEIDVFAGDQGRVVSTEMLGYAGSKRRQMKSMGSFAPVFEATNLWHFGREFSTPDDLIEIGIRQSQIGSFRKFAIDDFEGVVFEEIVRIELHDDITRCTFEANIP